MRKTWILLAGAMVLLVVGILFWLAAMPGPPPDSATTAPAPGPAGAPLRIGLVPERDIFHMQKRYQGLAEYLSSRLGRPVEMVLVNTYEAVLLDFQDKEVDAAFLGSMVAALAMDRLGAEVVVKPELPGGVSTYCGVLFVKDDSPIRTVDQLAGHSVAMVRTTTAADLFPISLMARRNLLGRGDSPKIVWVGTHDDVATAVMEGQTDAGAIKNQRLDVLLERNATWKIRRLATSPHVPNNALVLRADVAKELGGTLTDLLLKMDSDPRGRQALATLGAVRFLPCHKEEYRAIYEMAQELGSAWDQVGVKGPPPRMPASSPSTSSPSTR